MNLPPHSITTRLPSQREHLRRWLAERELDLRLREKAVPEAPATGLVYHRASRTTTPPPRAGDIVIARPSAYGNEGPLYLAVLAQTPHQHWRVVPFSRYALPAVPGEWQTPLDAPALRVLCFWNVREVVSTCLLPGAVRRLTPTRLARLRALDTALADGCPIADSNLGPPLVHPADPRYLYLEEERTRVDEHVLAVSPALENQDEPETRDAILVPFKKPEWLLAAEGRPAYAADAKD